MNYFSKKCVHESILKLSNMLAFMLLCKTSFQKFLSCFTTLCYKSVFTQEFFWPHDLFFQVSKVHYKVLQSETKVVLWFDIFNKKETTDQHASATGKQIYQYFWYVFIYCTPEFWVDCNNMLTQEALGDLSFVLSLSEIDRFWCKNMSLYQDF